MPTVPANKPQYKTQPIDKSAYTDRHKDRHQCRYKTELKAYLCKGKANHEKLFILRIEKKINQEDCVGVVAKVLSHTQTQIVLK